MIWLLPVVFPIKRHAYVSRNLSYDGVTYDRLTHNLTERQKFDYNKIADAWEVVCTNIEKALGVTNASLNGYAKGKVHSALWGSTAEIL